MTQKSKYKILFVGDVVGSPGRKILENSLAEVQWDNDIDFTIVNGENATGGRGINGKTLNLFKDLGIDVVTMGNHTWDNRDIFNFINHEPMLLRPLNYPKKSAGAGYGIFPMGDLQVAVISLIGRTFLNNVVADCPFAAINEVLAEIRAITPIIIVDIHAEATSEKIAMSRFLDGRVSGVFGTHTHVQTNDARILPKCTAYLTDAGMTGPRDSILGMEIEPIVQKFLDGIPTRFQVAEGDAQFNGVVVEVDALGQSTDLKLINFYKASN